MAKKTKAIVKREEPWKDALWRVTRGEPREIADAANKIREAFLVLAENLGDRANSGDEIPDEDAGAVLSLAASLHSIRSALENIAAYSDTVDAHFAEESK